MTFGAIFASILAVVAASDGQAEAFPSEAASAAAHPETTAAGPSTATPLPTEDGTSTEPPAAAGTAPATDGSTPTPAPGSAAGASAPAAEPVRSQDGDPFADAARVALSAAAAGTPIVVAPAPDPAAEAAPPPDGAPSPADGASPPSVDAAPATPGDAPESPPLSAAPAGPPLSTAAPILLERVEEPDGWATERLIEPSGDIVLHTVNAAGTVQVCRTVGSLLALALVEQRPAAGGEYVHVARDASGALVSYAIGTDGEPRAVSLVAPAPR